MSIEKAKLAGHRIGITFSTFDVIHPGHIAMLSESKSNCDFLICGLLSDPTIDRPKSKNAPIQSLMERFTMLNAIKYVDLIVPVTNELDIYNTLLLMRPNVRFVGEEYRDKHFTGKEIDFIEIFYNSRKHNYSSSSVKNKIKNSKMIKITADS